MKLIHNWKRALRFFSVQMNLLGTALSTGYATMYDKLKETVSPATMAVITGAVFVLGVLARVIDQDMKEDDDATH